MSESTQPSSQRSAAERAPSPTETGLEALAWAVSTGAASELVRKEESRGRRRRLRQRAAAGSALCLLLLTGFWLRPGARITPAKQVATESRAIVVAPESRTLPDGSAVELKAGAVIVVEFGPSARRVLLRAGEAHFQVFKDSARPFVVSASGVETRAVGTAFSVSLGARAVDVLVTEGRVAVSHVSGATRVEPTVATVEAGQGAVVSFDGDAPSVAPVVRAVSEREQRERLNWRVPLLEFFGTSLAEAVTLFNRHAASRLTLDPVLGQLRLSGRLRADDTDSLLLLLRNEFGIVTEPMSDGSVRLFRP